MDLEKLKHCAKMVKTFNTLSNIYQIEFKKAIKIQLAVLASEIEEVLEALNHDFPMEDVLKELCDVKFSSDAAFDIASHEFFDAEGALEEVCKNNLTKFPHSRQVADETVESFKTLDVEAYWDYNAVFGKYVIIRAKDSKVMKPTNYVKCSVAKYV